MTADHSASLVITNRTLSLRIPKCAGYVLNPSSVAARLSSPPLNAWLGLSSPWSLALQLEVQTSSEIGFDPE
jgi:hypothetical protein